MATQCRLVQGAFHVISSQVHLLLRVLMSKMLILGVVIVLVPEVLISRLAVLEVLETLMLSKTWEYTHDHLES